MKRIITLLALAQMSIGAFAQSDTTLVRSFELESLKSEVRNLEVGISNAKASISEIKRSNAKLAEDNKLLGDEVAKNQISIAQLQDSLVAYRDLIHLNSSLSVDNKSAISDSKKQLENRSVMGIIAFCLSVILSAILAVVLYRRSKTDISKLKEQAESLNKKIVEKLTSEATEISKITSAISNTKPDVDHSLIKTIADRITFMEMTLYKMDSSIRGHKQLSKSIKQMKDNLLANGYELVDMLGKPYHEGMKVLPNFVEDEAIEEGKQIITGIVKPQINYNGVMIQSAQITVSQN